MKYYAFLSLLACLLVASCKEETIPPTEAEVFGEAYFPLQLGQTWVYAVDSITLRPEVGGVRYDTVQLQAREQLLDSFQTAAGELWYTGERWERADESRPWVFKSTFAMSRDRRTATKTVDNLSFTKISFPAAIGRRWDGHTAFDAFRPLPVGGEFLDVYANWTYEFRTIGAPFTLVNGSNFPDVLIVDQAMVDNLIDRRVAYEVYAKDLGLVASFIDARHTQCRDCCGGETSSCLSLPWDDKAEKGFIFYQELIRQ